MIYSLYNFNLTEKTPEEKKIIYSNTLISFALEIYLNISKVANIYSLYTIFYSSFINQASLIIKFNNQQIIEQSYPTILVKTIKNRSYKSNVFCIQKLFNKEELDQTRLILNSELFKNQLFNRYY